MKIQKKTAVLGAAAAALAAGIAGVGVATAAAGDDESADRPITGAALQKASEAALAHTGEGTVTGTEVGDEEGFYEVEVTLEDGSETDVHLTEDFAVLGAQAESDDENDENDAGDEENR